MKIIFIYLNKAQNNSFFFQTITNINQRQPIIQNSRLDAK